MKKEVSDRLGYRFSPIQSIRREGVQCPDLLPGIAVAPGREIPMEWED